ncbi:hypothetical protein ACFRJ8_14930 [Arthrobacter sp. NPDC056886]|uniref:hypothetical protein n=1 Tax=Arthrobacter sp. NPDC056886 TaxID=3345960 RepID=UPI00366BD1EB
MSEMERVKEYLAGFGLVSVGISTVEEWQFLNDDGFWVKANPNCPEESARNNAKYYGTNKVRSREVTYTDWKES